MNLDKEEIDFLIELSQCLFNDGMVNYTREDFIKFKEIKKKHEKPLLKGDENENE